MAYLKAPSGTGKTTLMKAMMGLVPALKLRMIVGGFLCTERTDRDFWRQTVQGRILTAVFQHADEALNLRSRVRDVFRGLPLPEGSTVDSLRKFLRLMFSDEEIENLLFRRVQLLSGGQKQKLNLLRALVLNTDGIILDEPLNGLDFHSGQTVLRMLDAKRREGKGILVISHNEEIFDTQADDVYYLKRDTLSAHASAHGLTQTPAERGTMTL